MTGIAMQLPKAALRLLIVAAVLTVVGANAHLVYVAVTSQPECIAHARLGEGETESGRFGAARSSCNPQKMLRQGP